MIATTCWFSIIKNGDENISLSWFETEFDAGRNQNKANLDMTESFNGCIGFAETYVGSNIHLEAEANSRNIRKVRDSDDAVIK